MNWKDDREDGVAVFRRFTMFAALTAAALGVSLAAAQPALARPMSASTKPVVRVVKGHIVPDQSQFAGPETTPNPNSSLQPRARAITPQFSIYDCWDVPSTGNCNLNDPATVFDSGHRCSDDAVTVVSAFAYDSFNGGQDMLVEQRWSPHCQTNWTRVTSYMGNRTHKLQTDLFAQNHSNIDYQSSCGSSCTSLWGPMYYAPQEQVNSQGTITIADPRCCFLPDYRLQATARGYN